ncbi:MAG: hypothetical protein HYS13_01355 [Planctomycetia bacterium]|nr:hypothetical protein [Planctomycetia bacterium]
MSQQEPGTSAAPEELPAPRNLTGALAFALALLGLVAMALPTLELLGMIDFLAPLSVWKMALLGAAPLLAMALGGLAIFRLPKGPATGGLVLGLIGSLWLLGLAMCLMAEHMNLFVDPETLAQKRLLETVAAVKRMSEDLEQRSGADPSLATGQIVTTDTADGWGNPLRYTIRAAGLVSVISAGPDGELGNEDDIKTENLHVYEDQPGEGDGAAPSMGLRKRPNRT